MIMTYDDKLERILLEQLEISGKRARTKNIMESAKYPLLLITSADEKRREKDLVES